MPVFLKTFLKWKHRQFKKKNCCFFISGRMGMLITLYLIQMNTYNSVKAPPKRGFSSIEEWFVGMQAPILIAILEYGILLALKKFFSRKHFDLEMIFKKVDLFSFLACTIYIAFFTISYFSVWETYDLSSKILYYVFSKFLNNKYTFTLNANT